MDGNLEMANNMLYSKEHEYESEIWKDIPDYEGLYQVSDLGRVKSLSRTVKYKNGRSHILKEKIRKQTVGGHGYLQLGLSKNDTVKKKYVHKLVAMAFLNHIPKGNIIVVDHIDNDKLNNRLENLQLINQRYNCSKDKKRDLPVGMYKVKNRYKSYIRINQKLKCLGTYDTVSEASKAYQNALVKLK